MAVQKRAATARQGGAIPRKTILLLTDQQVGYLDHVLADVRQTSGAVLKRTALVRAIIDALMGSGIDFSKARSEAEVTAILAKRLKG